MTNCIRQPLLFSSLKNKKIQADFNGGSLTSDAGALLVREVDKHHGLIDAINRCIPDPRNEFFIVHQQRTMLAQRILGIALGYEDLNDHQSLRDDPLLQIVTERGVTKDGLPLASPPTLCRLENRVDRKSLVDIAKVFVERFIASYTQTPDELIFDFDPTDDPVHGNQEKRFFHGCYDHYCFLPFSTAGCLSSSCGYRWCIAHKSHSEITGKEDSTGLAECKDYHSLRQWFLSVETYAMVRQK